MYNAWVFHGLPHKLVEEYKKVAEEFRDMAKRAMENASIRSVWNPGVN